jgi:hypothetical protein
MALPPFFGINNRSMYTVPVSGGSSGMQSLRAVALLAAKMQTQSVNPGVAKTSSGRKPKLVRRHR